MLKKDIYDKVKTIKESNINLQVRNINFQMNLNYSESFILKNIYLLFINSLTGDVMFFKHEKILMFF